MDPSTMALVGAGVGAMMDDEQPLRGAMLGGVGGYAGGTMMGAGGMAGSQAGMTGTGGYMGANLGLQNAGALGAGAGSTAPMANSGYMASQMALPTVGSSSAPAFGAGMTAGATPALQGAPVTLGGPMSLQTVGTSIQPPAPGLLSKLPTMSDDSVKAVKAGQALSGMGNKETPKQPVIVGQAPKLNPSAGGSFTAPQREDMMNYLFTQPSMLPGFRR